MTNVEIKNLAREADWDRYIASLFMLEAVQPHVWALLSFSGDVAAIQRKVSEPAIGEIRLQWWHDTLGAIAQGDQPDHPVATALSAAISAHNLPIAPLQALVDAHRFDLYADVARSWTEVEGYLGETEGLLFQLTALILNPNEAPKAAEASGFAGVALGLARTSLNPALRAKLTPEGATDADFVNRAQQRRNEAELAISKLPKELFGSYLPLATASLYLNSQKAPSRLRKQWAIWRAARREKI